MSGNIDRPKQPSVAREFAMRGALTHETRIEFLDALRGLAIMMVIVNHSGGVAGIGGVAGHVASLGAYGVQLFFVISACTIFLSFQHARARESAPNRNFYIRRLMRIVPVYWFGIVLYAVVYGAQSRYFLAGPEPWHYPFHALLLNVLHPATQSSAVPGGWSISCEVMFYLTVPLWFAVVTTRRRAIAFTCVAIVAGPLLVEGLAQWLAPALSGHDERVVSLFWYRNPINQMGSFAFGILLYFLLRDGTHDRFRVPVANLSLCAAAAAVLLIGTRAPTAQHFYAAAFMLFALALAAIPWRIFVNGPMKMLGRISYSAYLLHFLVLRQLSPLLQTESDLLNFVLLAVCGIGLTAPLAYLSFRCIETPAIRFGKHVIATLDQRVEPPCNRQTV